jgi:hypothetical protein
VSITLTQRVASAKAELAAISAQRAMLDRAEIFEKRAREFGLPAQKISALVGSVEAMREGGITIDGLDTESLQRWSATFRQIREAFVEQPESIVEPVPPGKNVQYALLDPMEKLPSVIENAVLQAWQAWIVGKSSFARDDQLALLNDAGMRLPVASIQEKLGELQRRSKTLPQSRTQISEVVAIGEELADQWHTLLGDDGISTSVRTFLSAASSRDGAPYLMMTEEVVAWLSKRDRLNALRIRLSCA